MSVCTFFGHRDCPGTIRLQLKNVLITLIEECGVDVFYVGHQGAFDAMVRSVLQELMSIYPNISYAVVLERMPVKKDALSVEEYADTMLPEGIERVHPRYAISWRNRWMLGQADYVVVYVAHSWGGAAKFAEMAKRQKKTVINLAVSRNAVT